MAEDTPTLSMTPMVVEPLSDSPHAPFVFFDAIGPRGYVNGLVLLTVSALRQLPAGNGCGIRMLPTITAHLRTNVQGAIALRDALNEAIAVDALAQSDDSRPN